MKTQKFTLQDLGVQWFCTSALEGGGGGHNDEIARANLCACPHHNAWSKVGLYVKTCDLRPKNHPKKREYKKREYRTEKNAVEVERGAGMGEKNALRGHDFLKVKRKIEHIRSLDCSFRKFTLQFSSKVCGGMAALQNG
jgi:hypothetical protein